MLSNAEYSERGGPEDKPEPVFRLRMRLGEKDRERYPRGDEWFTYDAKWFRELSVRELRQIEKLTHRSRGEIGAAMENQSTDGLLLLVWLARRAAGVDEPFDGFEPLPGLFEAEEMPDPPAETSPSTPTPGTD